MTGSATSSAYSKTFNPGQPRSVVDAREIERKHVLHGFGRHLERHERLLESPHCDRVHQRTEQHEDHEGQHRAAGGVAVVADEHQQVRHDPRPRPIDARGKPHADLLDGDGVGFLRLTVAAQHAAQFLIGLRPEGLGGRMSVRKLAAQPGDAAGDEFPPNGVAEPLVRGAFQIEVTVRRPAAVEIVDDAVELRAVQQKPALRPALPAWTATAAARPDRARRCSS